MCVGFGFKIRGDDLYVRTREEYSVTSSRDEFLLSDFLKQEI